MSLADELIEGWDKTRPAAELTTHQEGKDGR